MFQKVTAVFYQACREFHEGCTPARLEPVVAPAADQSADLDYLSMNEPVKTHNSEAQLTPAMITVIYIVVGVLWIPLTDWLLAVWIEEGAVLSLLQALKSGVFILITAGLLYLLIQGPSAVSHYLAQRLWQEHAKSDAVIESTTDVVFIKDLQGCYTLINPAGERFFDKPAEQILGRDDRALFTPATAQGLREQDCRIVASGQVQVFESTSETMTGHTRTHSTTKSPYRNAEGRIIGVIGIAHDITERKQAEEQLRRSETRFRASVENLLDCFALYSAVRDAGGRVVDLRVDYVNAAACHSHRLRAEEQIGRNLLALLPIHGSSGLFEKYRRVLDTGEPLAVEAFAFADGDDERFCGRVFDIRASKLEDSLVVAWRDVTERRRAEEALRISEQRFRVALQGSPMTVFNQDRTLRYTWVYNPMPGLTAEQVLGKRDQDIAERPEEAAVLGVLKRQVVDSEAGLRTEVAIHGGGTLRWYDLNLEPLRDLDERVIGITGAAFDITGRKALEAELRSQAERLAEADRRKDEFLAMLGHELRNPLAPIRSALDVLKLRGPLPQELRWALEMIDHQVEQMTHLVNDLLDVARITRGRIELRKQPLDLAVVVKRAAEVARPLLETRRQSFTVALPEQPLYLEADPTRLEQVISNLLTNAAKYTEQGGRIELAVQAEDTAAVIRVRDNGIGIAPALLPHIFEPFTQASQSLARSKGGLGLGLTLVRRLVEMHGGRVDVVSAGPGRGSEFTVYLPRTAGRPPARPDAPAPAPPALRARRILVVEDNVAVARSLAALLQTLGHAVQVVHDGDAALEAVRGEPPDIVFLDIGLPGMDGYEVARRLRRDYAPQALYLVALTGYGQEEDIRRARAAGFDRHLLKPVTLGDLQGLLGSLAQSRE